MAQLVTIELKPLVKIRNWNRDCINPAKYSQTAPAEDSYGSCVVCAGGEDFRRRPGP